MASIVDNITININIGNNDINIGNNNINNSCDIPSNTETDTNIISEPSAEPSGSAFVADAEPMTPKDKLKLRILNKVKELISEDDIINELLTNPTLQGKRKWQSREEISRVLYLNIDEPEYAHLDDKIMDMYNNGMKDEYLETTDKYMMECVADYLGIMDNFQKKQIDYYVRAIRSTVLPEDTEYIEKNYYHLANLVENCYKNVDLSLKIQCMSNHFDYYRYISNDWYNEKLTHTPLNKTLIFLSFIYCFVMEDIEDNLALSSHKNKVDFEHTFNFLDMKQNNNIAEFLNLADELGFPRELIKERPSAKILAGKLALNTCKTDDCPVCMEQQVQCVPINWVCGHYICVNCHNDIVEQQKCPICRFEFKI